MLATLHATSQSKPLLPPHKRHLSLDGPLPRRNSLEKSAEAASEFEVCNVQLQSLPGEAGSSSEEGPTKERRQARGFASTFTRTASAAELWQAAGSAGKDLRSSTLFSGGSARSPTLSAMEEGTEQEQDSARAAQIARQSRQLFPMPIWQQNVQIIVPSRPPHQMHSQEKSPFLLALNQRKLTPFQTLKAYEKTRKLIIQQGIGSKLNVRPPESAQAQRPLKKRAFYGHRSLVAFPSHLASPRVAPAPQLHQSEDVLRQP